MTPTRARVALLLVVAAAVIPVCTYRGASLAWLFFDDSYYYLQIARNAAAGRGLTFDGIHRTNGFQPLWLTLLVPLARLLDDRYALLRGAVVLQAALVTATAALIFDGLRPRWGAYGAATAALLLVALPDSTTVLFGGMETALVTFLLAALWRATQRLPGGSPRDHLLAGALAALLMLARLEAALAVPLLLLAERRRLCTATALLLAGPAALAATAYVTWNRVTFGLWLPVSALVKKHVAHGAPLEAWIAWPWPGDVLVQRTLSTAAYQSWGTIVGALLLAATVALVARSAGTRARLASVGAGLVVGTTALTMLTDKVSVVLIDAWERAPLTLTVALVGGAVVSGLDGPRRRAAALALVAALTARHTLHVWRDRGDKTYGLAAAGIAAAAYLDAHSPPDAHAGSWNAGLVGFFSHRNIINLDGLVNDAAYYREVVLRGQIGDRLERERIDWIVERDLLRPERRHIPFFFDVGAEALASSFVEVAHFGVAPVQGETVWRRR